MIHVEGYELEVIKGAIQTIRRLQPLIVFEYNHISKQHFKVEEIKETIGDQYKIFRLRAASFLDNDIDNAWNCIAIPSRTIFEEILSPKICVE